jgi:aryl-alcohol dehydrogenase-like predicted oxidoreductase
VAEAAGWEYVAASSTSADHRARSAAPWTRRFHLRIGLLRLFRDGLGFAELVDHDVFRPSLHDGLDLRGFVSREDDEAVGLGVDTVVLGDGQADQTAAALPATLAEDFEHLLGPSAGLLFGLLDLAVGRAEHCFVLRDALVPRFHAREFTPLSSCASSIGTLARVRTRTLGPLQVSVVGLGCNNFGRRVDQAGTRAVVDAALDAGVTFFDTAESYGGGKSEAFLGQALRGRRDQAVIATKFGGGASGRGMGSREEIGRALEGSLERLQTDYVDLYQHHQEDPETPLADTIEALDDLVREGKIRSYGTSNYSPAKLDEAAALAQEAYVSEQSEYSFLERKAEEELLPICRRLGLGFIPYFPLASGLLTGKYRRGEAAPEGTRLHGREIDDEQFDRVERLAAFASERRVTLLELAIGGLAAQDPVTSVIAGATRPEQVRANAAAGAWEPTADEFEALVALG